MIVRMSALLLLMLASPVQANEPTISLHIQPITRLLDTTRAGLRQAGGELFVTLFNRTLDTVLTGKGFDGLDIRRPWGIAARLEGTIQDYQAVLIVPITGETAFIDFLKRIGYPLRPESSNIPGVSRLPPWRTPEFDVPLFLRCKGDHAYIALGSPLVLADDKLPNPRGIAPDDDSLASLRIRMDRLAMPVKKTIQLGFELIFWDEAPNDPLGRDLHALFSEIRPRWYQMGFQDAKELRLDGDFDSKNGTFRLRTRIDGKPGTMLAQATEGRQVSRNAFANTVPTRTAIRILGQLPQFDAQWSQMIARALGGFADAQAPGSVFAEGLRALARSVQQREADFGLFIREPGPADAATITLAIRLNDTRTMETAIRQNARQLGVRLDVAEIHQRKVHELDLNTTSLPIIIPTMTNDAKTARFVFTPDALYLSIGPDAKTALADVMALTPATAPALSIEAFPTALSTLLEKRYPDRVLAAATLQRFAKEPSIDLLRLDIEGGNRLTLTLRIGYWLWLSLVE